MSNDLTFSLKDGKVRSERNVLTFFCAGKNHVLHVLITKNLLPGISALSEWGAYFQVSCFCVHVSFSHTVSC